MQAISGHQHFPRVLGTYLPARSDKSNPAAIKMQANRPWTIFPAVPVVLFSNFTRLHQVILLTTTRELLCLSAHNAAATTQLTQQT